MKKEFTVTYVVRNCFQCPYYKHIPDNGWGKDICDHRDMPINTEALAYGIRDDCPMLNCGAKMNKKLE